MIKVTRKTIEGLLNIVGSGKFMDSETAHDEMATENPELRKELILMSQCFEAKNDFVAGFYCCYLYIRQQVINDELEKIYGAENSPE
jgi:hypothetical protein